MISLYHLPEASLDAVPVKSYFGVNFLIVCVITKPPNTQAFEVLQEFALGK